ncbi:MAG: hypothetical protein ACKO83_00300 [Roseiflexaceae bacterium]
MSTPRWGRYTDLHPDALAQILAHTPIAVLPWGALEWHGAHLPLGMVASPPNMWPITWCNAPAACCCR